MTSRTTAGLAAQARTRLELARGHWSLGECDEAVLCLERLAAADPGAEGLAALLQELREDLAVTPDALSERIDALVRRLPPAEPIAPAPESPLATGTLAGLLAEQGHGAAALEVAEGVLRARPDDQRALAVREQVHGVRTRRALERLERWLGEIERIRRRREAQA
jgi:hypothetical protein